MDDLATRGHVVVCLEDDRVLLIREVRSGQVSYVAPGTAIQGDETPGRAAIRAARQQLGVDVTVTELFFADTESGVEHFFFLAELESDHDTSWDEPVLASDPVSATAVRRAAIRGYPVRPFELARRLASR